MPPRIKAKASRATLIVGLACQVPDPLAELPPALLRFIPLAKTPAPACATAAAAAGTAAVKLAEGMVAAAGDCMSAGLASATEVPLELSSAGTTGVPPTDAKALSKRTAASGVHGGVGVAVGGGSDEGRDAEERDSAVVVSDQDLAEQGEGQAQEEAGVTATAVAADASPPPVAVRFHHYTSAKLPPHLMHWAFTLVKDSLLPMYEQVWGWSDSKKHKQLQAAASRFVVGLACVTDTDEGQPAAYINYRFEQYEGQPVCYLYEVMVAQQYRRLGIGKHLLGLVEQMAWHHGMDKCVLTEFTANVAAERFYRKCGYKPDATNPGGACGYVIMSKRKP